MCVLLTREIPHAVHRIEIPLLDLGSRATIVLSCKTGRRRINDGKDSCAKDGEVLTQKPEALDKRLILLSWSDERS